MQISASMLTSSSSWTAPFASSAASAARSEVARGDLPLDLRGALDDLEDLRVAQPLLDRVVAHDSRAAEHLHGLGRGAHRRVRRERLRVGAEQARVLAQIERGGGAPDEQPRRLDLHAHLGQLEGDALLGDQRLAEGLALARVRGRVLEGGARDAHGPGRDLRPRGLEEVHRDGEAAAFLTEQPAGGDPRAVENDRARVGGAEPELVLLAPRLHARVPALEQEGGDRPVELREDDRELRDAAVRDVALLPLEHVAVAVAARGRADRGEVGAGLRLGERDRREAAALVGEPRQIALALLLGAEPEKRPNREHRRLDRRRERGAAPGELLGDQRRGDVVDPAAAVLARDRVARQPPERRVAQQLGRRLAAGVALGGDRAQLTFGELVRERLQLALLRRELEADQKTNSSTPPLTFSSMPVM